MLFELGAAAPPDAPALGIFSVSVPGRGTSPNALGRFPARFALSKAAATVANLG